MATRTSPAADNQIFLVGSGPCLRLSGERLAAEDSPHASDVFIAEFCERREDASCRLLARLLQARPRGFPDRGWLVVPRRGMSSSWSVKAAEIARECGIRELVLLERGLWHRGGPPPHDSMLTECLPAADLAVWLKACGRSEPAREMRMLRPCGILRRRIAQAAAHLGLRLDESELGRLAEVYGDLRRDPTDAELMLVAQTNSEHCRHNIFRSPWKIAADGRSLFDSVKATHLSSPQGTLSAYDDNAAVLELAAPVRLPPASSRGRRAGRRVVHTVLKAETHNHPTAISPFPGAATGTGGEIRDEAACGRGAASRAGFAGYILSDLRIPDAVQPWEQPRPSFPPHICAPLDILVRAPLGAAAFGNEFGRPNLAGFLRTFERCGAEHLGYHKPVMIAGGVGEIYERDLRKLPVEPGNLIVQLGGPGWRVGINGGGASSGASCGPDYASVQRDNAEMQRRVQEVIDACRRSARNILRSIHDVGSGGLGNAAVELAGPAGCAIDLARVPVSQLDLSDAEILCNEAQERYVVAIRAADLAKLRSVCIRERCPAAVIGKAASDGMVTVRNGHDVAVSLPYGAVVCNATPPAREALLPVRDKPRPAEFAAIDLAEAACRVLRHPAVSDKSFLITICDRTVGGLTARDQLVGPWQVPVADCAVSLAGHGIVRGRAFSLGERPAVAVRSPAASARLAVAEALTNLAAADVGELRGVRLSLNWMADCGEPARDGELVAAVRGVCDSFLRELGISVPVGKDSLSMRAEWRDGRDSMRQVRSPLTCVATAAAAVADAARTLTPQLSSRRDTVLLLLRAHGEWRAGASIFAQCFAADGGAVPDIEAGALRALWDAVASLRRENLALAYHDISDGGLFATACEMGFAANRGVTLALDALCQPGMGPDVDGRANSGDAIAPGGVARMLGALFAEEVGALIEIARADMPRALQLARAAQPQTVGWPAEHRRVTVLRNGGAVFARGLDELRREWSALSHAVRELRDDPVCAREEAGRDFGSDGGLFARGPFPAAAPRARARPVAAVLREQGTNGHEEMAFALDYAGFSVRVIAMADLPGDARVLRDVRFLVLPGGFSYGDTLGAGRGQAMKILNNPGLRGQFADFFAADTLALGVCNGCQVLSLLSPLLTGGAACRLPEFRANRSRRFEARLVMVEVLPSPSPLLASLAGCMLPVPVSSGEGRAVPAEGGGPAPVSALRYVDHRGRPARGHPHNPGGSRGGLCGFCSPDGRVTVMMPHPERAVRAVQMSWVPPAWQGATPWLSLFTGARRWLA